ncbi:MAG: glycosyltransferase [Bacteroidetes bacterium]|nr:glycosyltransferase [Bacteroidota bacterium]
MSDLKPVLIVSYYFPPAGGPGVQRVLKFCKYLPQFGFRPIVLTVENGEFPAEDASLFKDIPPETVICRTFIPEPYSIYKRFTGMKKSDKFGVAFVKKEAKSRESWKEKFAVWTRGNFFIPDARVWWRLTAVSAGKKLVKKYGIEVVFSSGPPHSVHLIANSIRKSTGISWVADFRDPWTGIDYYAKLKLTWLADKLHHHLEKSVLTDADQITVVSESMKRDFSAITSKPISVIPNGFDAEELPLNPKTPAHDKLVISYIGNMYPVENWASVFSTIRNWIKQFPELKDQLVLKFAGTQDGSVLALVKENGLESNLQLLGYLNHDQALIELFDSTAVLLVINSEPGNEHVLTGKLFEYLSTGKPILFSGPIPGDAWTLLEKAGNAIKLENVNPLDLKTMKPAQRGIDSFTRKKLTEELAILLTQSIEQKRKRP